MLADRVYQFFLAPVRTPETIAWVAMGFVVNDSSVICPLHGYKFSLIDGHGIDNELSVHSHEVMERFGELYVKLQPGREDNDAHATAS